MALKKHRNSISNNMNDMKKIWRDPTLLITIIFVILSLAIFIIYPLVAVLKVSFVGIGGFTLDAYLDTLKSLDFQKTLKNTLTLGVTVGFLSTLIGFIFAYADSYIKSHFKKLFKVVSLLPIISPPFVLALSAIMLFGQYGLITRKLFGIQNANIYGFHGLVMVQTMTFFPVAYLLLTGLLKRIDPSLEEAARNMGASRWKTFKTVTLPLMAPGLANAFLLTFIETVADFSNPMVIGGNYSTLATQIYLQAIGNYDMQGGAAVAVILLSISILLFVLEKYWIEKKSYVTVTGKASRERDLMTEKHIVWPIDIICLLITVFVLAFYVLIPLGGFFKVMGVDYSLTLDHFKYVFKLGGSALKDTTYLAAIATPITGIYGMIIAFLIVRKKFYGKGFIEFTSLLAMAVPGTVIGIGYVSAYNTKPLVLTGTGAIIVISFIMRSVPVGVRSGVSALQQIDPSIEEAASDLGAGSTKVFTSITLPLIKSAFFSGLVYTFVRSMTAVSAVIFLVSARYKLLTVQILSQVDSGRFGVASAFSTILIIIVYIAISLMYLGLSKMGVSREEM
ncbi:ABC transporter permease [Clostridium algidicarnis]|uniref:Iron(III) transport system permease protein n=1 Tax=Clostridium algidicarnis DSM 15099 TaxID=1121295 RepID=A0A2S6FWY1_9CLOT|nr:iron ABC transporter permease [Clostridium algidicarnis]PPK48106.1 iron(III) transport system permease protein [Clostridium algidicarnis DSM 15099]